MFSKIEDFVIFIRHIVRSSWCRCMCGEILIALGGMLFGENVEGIFREGCMRSLQCEVDFGYKLRICARSD